MNDNNNTDNDSTDDVTFGDDNNMVTRTVSAIEHVHSNWIPYILAFVGAGLCVFVWQFYDLTVPPWVWDVGIGVGIVLIPSWVVASLVVDWLVEDTRIRVVALDALTDYYMPWDVPQQAWEEAEIIGGKPYRSDEVPGVIFVRDLRINDGQLEVLAPWEGELNDVEVKSYKEAIEANRGKNREWAEIGQTLYASHKQVVSNIKSEMVRKYADDSMEALHGEDIKSIVQDSSIERASKLADSIETPSNTLEDALPDDVDVPEEWKNSGDQQ